MAPTGMGMVLRLAVGAGWVLGWFGLFAKNFAPGTGLFVALVACSAAVAGAVVGRWWAIVLPFAVLPVFALPTAYEPGGEPDYGLGLLSAFAFALVAVPSIAAGVWLRRRARS